MTMKKAIFTMLMLLTACMAQAVEVTTFEELLKAIKDNNDITLMNDITLTSDDKNLFRQYGDDIDDWPTYTKTFDGQGYTISGIKYDHTSKFCSYTSVALVSSASYATFRNIKLTNLFIQDDKWAAGLCVKSEYCTFDNCHVSGTINSGDGGTDGYVGGIVGEALGTTMTNCSADNVTVNSSDDCNAGGLIGRIEEDNTDMETVIENCTVSGNIFSDGSRAEGFAGGLIGAAYMSHSNCTITNCVNNANVSSNSNCVGGIVGFWRSFVGFWSSSSLTITNCANNGNITCQGSVWDDYAGGIFGHIEDTDATIQCCVNNGVIAGDNEIGGIGGQADDNVTVTNCYSHGTIYGNGKAVGAIIGKLDDDASISYSYTDAVVWNDGKVSNRWGAGVTDGTVSNTYYYYSFSDNNITSADRSRGKLTWLLNGRKSNSENVWRQNLSSTDEYSKDDAPVLCYNDEMMAEHQVVYEHTPCLPTIFEEIFRNSPTDSNHAIQNGVCMFCNYREAGYWEIGTADELISFMKFVNDNGMSQDAYLTADINLTGVSGWTAPIGTNGHRFSSIFNGQGHTVTLNQDFGSANYSSLFGDIENAVICNVKTAGIIYTTGKHAAGIVGCMDGTRSKVISCISDVVISSNTDGDGSHGGIVGFVNSDAADITDCMVSGDITMHDKTTSCGGMVGWKKAACELNLSDCVVRYTANGTISSDTGTRTFVRYDESNSDQVVPNLSNCYYLYPFGTAQGTQFTVPQLFSGELTNILGWSQELKYGNNSNISLFYDEDDLPLPPGFSGAGITHTRSFADGYNWGTLYLPFDITVSDNADEVTFYTPKSVNIDGETGSLILTEVDDLIIEKGTPVLFHRNDDSVASVSFRATNSNFATTQQESDFIDLGNEWYAAGFYSDFSITDQMANSASDACYFVAQDKFWRANAATTIGCYKMAFVCNNQQASAVKTFKIQIDGEATPTAIMQVEASDAQAFGTATGGNAAIYNLQGQRLSQPRSGQINIIGGKKVVMK